MHTMSLCRGASMFGWNSAFFAAACHCALVSTVCADDAILDEAAVIQRPVAHYIVEDRRIDNELTSTPLPLVDWGLVQAGFIEYVNQETRAIMPLGGPHDLTDPKQVEAVPFAVPHGVRIRAQPATPSGSFAEELFEPAFPWEGSCTVHTLVYDDRDRLYRLWYRTREHMAYAESADFVHWRRPLRPHVRFEDRDQTNILGVINAGELAEGDLRSVDEARLGYAGSFFIDPAAHASERFKCTFLAHLKGDTHEYARRTGRAISAMTGPASTVMFGAVSADGIGWRVLPHPIMLHDADTQTVACFDTVLQKLVMYTRLYEMGRRCVARSETSDFSDWPLPTNLLTPGANESPSVDYYSTAFACYPGRPQIRTMFCLAYDRATDGSTLRLATSRDSRTFHFVPGEPILRPEQVGAASSCFVAAFPGLVRTPDGRMLVFCDVHHTPHKFPRHRFGGSAHFAAVWPEDRLAALEAEDEGEFTTAALTLGGNRIALNIQADERGGIEVELRDKQFRLVDQRSFGESDVMAGDHRSALVTWNEESDLSHLRGQTIYLRFRLRSAKLFAISAVE